MADADDDAQAAAASGGTLQLTDEHHDWIEQFCGKSARSVEGAAASSPPAKEESSGFFDTLSNAVSAVGDAASSVVHGAVDLTEKTVDVVADTAGTVVHAAAEVTAGAAEAVVNVVPLPGSVKAAATASIEFNKGVVEGVADGVTGLVKGVAHLGGSVIKEGYDLATDEKERERVGGAIVDGAEAMGSFVKTAVTDPGKAGAEIEDAVSSAAGKVVQIGKAVYKSYEEAEAAGHGAEWLGKATGQVGVLVAGAVLTDGASLAGEGAAVAGEGAMVAGEGAALLGEGAAVAGEGAAVVGEGAAVLGEGAAVAGKGAAAASEGTTVAGEGAATLGEGGATEGAAEGTESVTSAIKGGEVPPGNGPPSKPPSSGGSGGDPAPESPEGLSFRKDLPEHLAGPDGWRGGRLNGTHNAQNAVSELEGRGAVKVDMLEADKPGYTVTNTESPGIDTLDYQVVNPNTGKLVSASKTTYDPALYTDEQMVEMSQQAGTDAFSRFKLNPSAKPEPFDTQVGDVTMRSYINFEPATNAPYVGNVHPIDPADAIYLSGGK